jgi:hypothetical protein
MLPELMHTLTRPPALLVPMQCAFAATSICLPCDQYCYSLPACPALAVVLACRNRSKADDMISSVRKQLAEEGYPPPSLEVQLLDLSELSSVRAFAEAWRKQGRPLHILINNAGVLNMTGGVNRTCNTGAACHSRVWQHCASCRHTKLSCIQS